MTYTKHPDGPWSTPRKMTLSPQLAASDSNFAGLIEAVRKPKGAFLGGRYFILLKAESLPRQARDKT